MKDNDEYLIQEYLDGDQDSFRLLVEKYTSSVYNFSIRFVGKDCVNDIVQDVFIKVWKNIKKFNNTKSNFKTWIFIITRNTITDYLRKKKMINFSSLDTEEESFENNIVDDILMPDEVMIQLEDKELLNRLLDKLPVSYREVLILHYQEEMTFIEISQLVGKPLNTVKSHHQRALIKLREMVSAPKVEVDAYI